MQNLYCRNVRNVKFPKIVAEEFAFYIVNSRGNITFEKVRQKSNEKDFIIIDSGGDIVCRMRKA